MADTFKFELTGVVSFKMGDVGAAGTMGASLTQYTGVKEATMVFDMAPPTTTDVNIEEVEFPYNQAQAGTPQSFTFELLGLKLSELVNFRGGTFTAGSGSKDKWEKDPAIANILQSIEIVSKDGDDNEMTYNFVKCRITTGQSQTNTKSDTIGLQVTASILQPIDGSGDPTVPYYYEGEDIA